MDENGQSKTFQIVRVVVGYLLVGGGLAAVLFGFVSFCLGQCAPHRPGWELPGINHVLFDYGFFGMLFGSVVVGVGTWIIPKDKRGFSIFFKGKR
jgi:hypothetical protein